jgi:hypothetical protein
MKCKHCGQEIEEEKTLKVKEWNLEFSYPIKHTETYDEIVVPKGWRLPFLWELVRLVQSEYSDWILDYEKRCFRYFYTKQTKEDISKNVVQWLYRNGVGHWDASWYSLLYSNSDGRVIFVREIK